MRRSRRGGHGGLEFGGSGEDSFVAVVVTKLTGALLFILLLTMVIMALLPKAVDLPSSSPGESAAEAEPLVITTPNTLPEAIAGHPYVVALAAEGGEGPLRWAVDGALPPGLTFDADEARLEGTPKNGTAEPVALTLRVSDGKSRTSQATSLLVYQSDRPLTTPSKWTPALPPIPWHAWLEQGVGFLILWLMHALGMNTLTGLQRWSLAAIDDAPDAGDERLAVLRRFRRYRIVVRAASLTAAAALAIWLVQPRS